MDVCDPNISYEDLKKRVEQDVGRTLNMSRKQICNLYANIRQDKLLLPPMVLSKDRTYMTDKKSPLTQADYERLFDKSTLKAQIKRLATKVQALVEEKNTKDELREAIFSRLRTMGVREPVRFATGTKKPKQTMSAPANFGMNRVNNNVNTVNRVNNTVNNTVNRVNNTVNTVNRVNNTVNNVNRVNTT
jgi:glutaredoxin 2